MDKNQQKKLLDAICELNDLMDSPTIKVVDGNFNEAVIRQAITYIKKLKTEKNNSALASE
jgi:hypothetical protein